MMKNVFLFGVLCFYYSMAHAQQPLPGESTGCHQSDARSIANIVEAWKANYNNGNAGNVAALYTEDAYYLTQHFITGIVKGRSAIEAYLQLGVDANYKIDSINIESLNVIGDFAYVIDRYYSTNAGEKAIGVNLVLLRRLNHQWFIVAHEAAVPDPKEAIRELHMKSTP